MTVLFSMSLNGWSIAKRSSLILSPHIDQSFRDGIVILTKDRYRDETWYIRQYFIWSWSARCPTYYSTNSRSFYIPMIRNVCVVLVQTCFALWISNYSLHRNVNLTLIIIMLKWLYLNISNVNVIFAILHNSSRNTLLISAKLSLKCLFIINSIRPIEKGFA